MLQSPTSGRPPLVQVRDVSRLYPAAPEPVRALDGVSLDIARGEVVAIAGPSGSGKTTLLSLLGALDKANSGSIYVEGRELGQLSARQAALLRRDRIGFVFQSFNLLPVLTALENVEYVLLLQGKPRAQRRQRAHQVLAEAGLVGLAERKPAELSGGQQQRVAIARALAAQPALILADEPTANLDSATAAALLDMMLALNQSQGMTFVFSTHDPQVMARAHRVIHLRDGRIDRQELHV